MGPSTASFPFNPSLFINRLKVESVGRMCEYPEVNIPEYVRVAFTLSKNEIHMFVQATKYKLCDPRDSACERIAFKTRIASYMDEW